jgi:hypothetical protein
MANIEGKIVRTVCTALIVLCLVCPQMQAVQLPLGQGGLVPLLLLNMPRPSQGQFHPFALFDSFFNDLSNSPLRYTKKDVFSLLIHG